MADYTLDWHGDEVISAVLARQCAVMGRVGLEVEGEAKKELYKGHGVETGTLRRSIHSAEEGYSWSGDDTQPSDSTPELGGTAAKPTPGTEGVVVEVGSGMSYALAVHQGHGSFAGYHYLTNAVEKVKPRIPAIESEMNL